VAIVNVPPISNGGPINVVQPTKGSAAALVNQPHSNERARALKSAARRQAVLMAANRKATRDAKAIESWQSPTATLLDSSSEELLKSLPQMNQSVEELKSFLPSRPK
jgi:gas vesicle protein